MPVFPTKDEPAKKRPSKSFRACWECKRPRLQNQGLSEVGFREGRAPSPVNTEESPCALHIGDRLNKLEQLFEKFVCRKFSNAELSPPLSRTETLVDSEEHAKPAFGLPKIDNESQNISLIGEGINIRRSLLALLPTQHDADIIFESTNAWMILQNGYKPTRDLYVNQDPQSYALDMSAIAKSHSTIIARTLLHIAICISALPPEFNTSCLQNIWSLEATMQNYVNTVTSLVTSHDSQISTLPGLETLVLLSYYHINTPNLRQAWLVNRRAMNLAYLMGFHRMVLQPKLSTPIEAVETAKFLWRSIIDSDRYLCLHLRLPFIADEYPNPDDKDQPAWHRRELGLLAREIGELDRHITPQSYVQALAIDEKLDNLVKHFPKEFWEVPNVPSTARSPESSMVLERLVVQIWHFEMKIFVHLPFLLRHPQESRFEFSKITALQASRNIIMRWFALRNSNITQACCRLAELGTFIATMTIGLDIIIEMGTKDQSEVKRTRANDFGMLCRVIAEMEKLAKASPREKIAARSALIIKKILTSLDPSRRSAQKARVTLPYFGTIELEYHKPPTKPKFDPDSETLKRMHINNLDPHVPVFSFVQNDLWPNDEDECLNFDITLYDGLEDQDTEGNWIF
ncbi:hypothetical protein B0J11DRAFT_427039 [Dendryphion nanum]|uniref:Xylanolytic transcriptional activator regulatory domain-containing protein n=1 Tax=Dendryphion nanum TaxID=256645 RepID=A0A9P9EA61_9PLEO|nr:hypothetical protein B0J11DRAFT_427039 [Dendryphion nanum]